MGGDTTLFDDEEDDENDEDEIVDIPSETDKSNDGGGSNLPAADDEGGIVRPVEDIESVVEVYDQFEKIKSELLGSEDVTKINTNNHINKSGWRKIATAFNLSIETLATKREVDNGVVSYTVTARATAPNGKTVTGNGMCASNESNHMVKVTDDKSEYSDYEDRDDVFEVDGALRRLKEPKEVNEHNIMATAETRAKNRAISDLVGGGEVSAEEMKEKMLG